MDEKTKKKILIVDDEEGIREILAFAFEMEGYPVSTAADGSEAFEKVFADVIDVVITDIRMPKKDGLTLLKEIRQKHQKLPFVIVMTAYSEFSEQEITDMGAVGLLQKPIDLNKLIKFVEAL